MNWIETLRPNYIPDDLKSASEVTIWREHLLQSILLLTPLAGIPIYLLEVNLLKTTAFRGLFIFVLALSILLPVLRNIPYKFRAISNIVLLFLTGFVSLALFGLHINAFLYLLAASLFTGIFFGFSSGLWTLAATVFSVSLLFALRNIPAINFLPPVVLPDTTSWRYLASSAVHTIYIGGITIYSIYALFEQLQLSLKQQIDLTKNLEQAQETLENKVQERTKDLHYRLAQIRTASAVSRAIATKLDSKALLQEVVDMMQKEMDLYYVGAFLLNDDRSYAELAAGTGKPGEEMLAAHHRLMVGGNSMIGWATMHSQARIALDVGEEAVRFNNPYLPKTHSELALPLMNKEVCYGALSIQSQKAHAFDQDDIRIFEGIADAIAVAIDNNRLFSEITQQLNEIQILNQAYLMNSWDDVQNKIDDLEYTYQSPQSQSHNVDEHTPAATENFPIRLRGQVIGMLSMETDSAGLNEDDTDFIAGVLDQLAVALENARLIMDTQRQAGLELKLSEIAIKIAQANNIDEVLRSTVEELAVIPNVNEITLQMLPNDSRNSNNRSVFGGAA